MKVTSHGLMLGGSTLGALAGSLAAHQKGKRFFSWDGWKFRALGGLIGMVAGAGVGQVIGADTPTAPALPATAQRLTLPPGPLVALSAPKVPATLSGWDGSGQPPGNW